MRTITEARISGLEAKAHKKIEMIRAGQFSEYREWLRSLSDEEVEEVHYRIVVRLSEIGFAPVPPSNFRKLYKEDPTAFYEYLKECKEVEEQQLALGRYTEGEQASEGVWQAYRAEGHPLGASSVVVKS